MSAIFTTGDYRAISLSLNTYGVQLDEPGDERLPQIPTRSRSGMDCLCRVKPDCKREGLRLQGFGKHRSLIVAWHFKFCITA